MASLERGGSMASWSSPGRIEGGACDSGFFAGRGLWWDGYGCFVGV
jgi:hypothetical protein